MDIVVKTLRGPIELQGLGAGVSIAEVKQLLHERHKDGPMAIPDPKLQRLVSTTPQGWWDNQRMRDLWLPPKRDEARDALRALRARASGASAQLLRASRSAPLYIALAKHKRMPHLLYYTRQPLMKGLQGPCPARRHRVARRRRPQQRRGARAARAAQAAAAAGACDDAGECSHESSWLVESTCAA